MSVKNLDFIFEPRSVALIGASPRAGSIGLVALRNLKAAGFGGPVYPINPAHDVIEGLKTYPNIAALPGHADLALICTPANTVPALVAELGANGTKAAIVISASGNSDAAATASWRQAILDAAKPNLLRIVGPNCVGVLSPPSHLNASFAHASAGQGDVALVAQSGAILTTVLDWANARGIGFSRLISLGDMSDVDFGDMLDYLAADRQTKAVFLYIEAITHARKFMSAARACARLKPVIIIKAGRHSAAAKAALSHTGALAGSDAVYDAAFRRAGALRVETLEGLFDTLEAVTLARTITGDRLAIVTNGGGIGVLATDSLLDRKGRLATLSPSTMAHLNEFLPAHWSHSNPIDIIGDADSERYRQVLEAVLADPEVDCTLAIHCPVAVASDMDCAKGVIEAFKKHPRPLLTNWLGDVAPVQSRQLLQSAGLPTFETPDDAIAGFMNVVDYQKVQQNLMQVPPAIPSDFRPDMIAAKRVLYEATAAKSEWLSAAQVASLLAAYQIPCIKSAIAENIGLLPLVAKDLSFPVALKVQSPDIIHKSDVGGVMLDLPDGYALLEAARLMTANIAKARPEARITGFHVQEMAHLPHAQELILGMTVDPTFGPILLAGHGGTAVEVINDKAIGFPPLNLHLAHDMLSRTKLFRQLQGYRDHPRADIDAIALTLVKLSQLVVDHPSIAEIDINPLLANEKGVICVDARIRLALFSKAARPALAISPYPETLVRNGALSGLGEYTIRPVRPDDATRFVAFSECLSGEDVRFRFMSAKRPLFADEVARLTQIDYDREMAFLLVEDVTDRIAGVVRLITDSEGKIAEFALIVRSDLKRKGIGRMLMTAILDYGKKKGLETIYGDVLRENAAMLGLGRSLGFSIDTAHSSAPQVRIVLKLKS